MAGRPLAAQSPVCPPGVMGNRSGPGPRGRHRAMADCSVLHRGIRLACNHQLYFVCTEYLAVGACLSSYPVDTSVLLPGAAAAGTSFDFVPPFALALRASSLHRARRPVLLEAQGVTPACRPAHRVGYRGIDPLRPLTGGAAPQPPLSRVLPTGGGVSVAVRPQNTWMHARCRHDQVHRGSRPAYALSHPAAVAHCHLWLSREANSTHPPCGSQTGRVLSCLRGNMV